MLHVEVTEIESIDSVGLHNSCQKHQWRNVDAYQHTYYCESIFLSKGNSKTWSAYRNDNLENSGAQERMRFCLHVKVFLGDENSIYILPKYKFNSNSKYLRENSQTTGSFLSLKKNFHKNSSMWKIIIKWLLIANL